ncbi:uncharacterized protein LOC126318307 [Schistocerca gregaria]|uniref:uncharacterized protein LOC126318307 n=1 Tax=Schistocerca gregaria TaxID=7010 RepID=UPI00211E740A|nr:uncharacterized protein LOC126318307 [Schistocerca gregaria]
MGPELSGEVLLQRPSVPVGGIAEKLSNKRKVKRIRGSEDEKEDDIENLLFGEKTVLEFGEECAVSREKEERVRGADGITGDVESAETGVPGFVIGAKSRKDNEVDPSKTAAPNKKAKASVEALAPAWTDQDDEQVDVMLSNRTRKFRRSLGQTQLSQAEYELALKEQFKKINDTANQSWATVYEEEADPNEASFLNTTEKVVSKRDPRVMPDKFIYITQLQDANKAGVSRSVVRCCQFHPRENLLLTAGMDKTLRLFDVCGKANHMVQSMFFENFPITTAVFSPLKDEIYLSGLRNCFYTYELLSGKVDNVKKVIGCEDEKLDKMLVSPDNGVLVFLSKEGKILVVSNKTKQWVTTLKMNSHVKCASFLPDGSELWTAGSSGEVYVWNMKTYLCTRRFKDDGLSPVTAMEISPNGKYLATGQESGVVNLYNIDDEEFVRHFTPQPSKSFFNLTTPVQALHFNHDSQLLGIASTLKRNSFRLIHVPSKTVFQNWPVKQTPLSRVASFTFSPDSSLLAIGNVRGNVRLYKLHYYQKRVSSNSK